MTQNINLEWAKYYSRLGMSIIPVQGKIPLVKWSEFQERKANEEEIKQWWEMWPQADIGCVTGIISKRLVLDIDGELGLQSISTYNVGNTQSVRTRRGVQYHYNYSYDINGKTTIAGLLQNVDVRGEGGICILPPSKCSDGTYYQWINGLDTPLAEVPEWLTKELIQPLEQIKESKTKGWIAEALESLRDGNKHSTFVSVLGRMRNDNYAKEDALALLMPYAKEKGVSETDVQERIDSVWGLYPSKEELKETTNGLIHFSINTDEYLKEIQERTTHVEPEFSTGFKHLDRLTRGYPRENIYVIGAPTNGGKTQFVLSSIHKLLRTGKRVLYFSTEMPQNEIKDRFNAIGAQIPLDELRTGFLRHESKQRLITYLQNTDLSNFIISPEDTPSIDSIRAAVEKEKPDILFIDHIHHIRTYSDNRRTDIDAFILGLKKLILEKGIPCVVTAQLRRKEMYEGHYNYTMHDFKESGGIENEAGVCLLLCPPDEWSTDKVQNCTAYICKNRHGRREVRFTLEFDTETACFKEPHTL